MSGGFFEFKGRALFTGQWYDATWGNRKRTVTHILSRMSNDLLLLTSTPIPIPKASPPISSPPFSFSFSQFLSAEDAVQYISHRLMLGTFFGEFSSTAPSPEKQPSNLHTTITTHLGNISLSIHPNELNNNDQRRHAREEMEEYRPEQVVSYRKGRDFFENSLCFRLQDLQEKSSKIISKLPSIHSKILKAQGFSRLPIEHPYLSTSSAFQNKLKIIRDLQQKIDQLQTNINNPLVCHESMRNIEKQINLDFQNYYQEIKENNQAERKGEEALESQESFDQKEDGPISPRIREGQTQTSILSVRAQKKEDNPPHIPVFIPKIIQIEIPYEIYKPKLVQRSNSEQSKNPSEQRGSLPAQSLGNSSCPKSANGSSIENIINRFNDRCYPQLDEQHLNVHQHTLPGQIYTYRINTVEHSQQQGEKQQFHLPLNSYENCGSQRGKCPIRLKKTDRSNFSSSEEEMDHRDEIWNKEEIQFNQENLSLVKEQQPAPSEHNSDNFALQSDQKDQRQHREQLLIELNRKISLLQSDNLELKGKLEGQRAAREEMEVQMRVIESRSMQMEIDYLQEMERMDEMREENRELNNLLISYKESVFKREGQTQELEAKIRQIQRQFSAKMEEKEGEIQEMVKSIHEKTEDLEEYAKINEEIKKILHKKQTEYEGHICELQTANHQLRQQLNFYKAKLEQQGINLKFEQARLIRDLLEKKDEEQKEKMQDLEKTLESKYKTKITELKIQKQRLEVQLQDLRKHPNPFCLQQLSTQVKTSLQLQIQDLLLTYNSQLFKKDEQITQLRKLSSQYKQFSEHSTEEEVRVITSIKNLLIRQKMDRENISNNMVQFVYVVDRLLRSIKLYEYTAQREKQERGKLTKKITSLNLFFNRELEKAEEKNFRLETQQQKAKRQAQEVGRELKKCMKKLQFYKSKLESPVSNGQLYNIFELQNQFLQLENKKLMGKYEKMKKYSEELQGKFINDIIKNGTSFCQHFCTQRQISSQQLSQSQSRQQQQFSKKITDILVQMKDEYNRSVLFASNESFLNQNTTKSKMQHCQLASSVFTVTNRPNINKIAPSPAIKALLTPLPEIPKSTAPTSPAPSITLDKLLQKRICATGKYKQKIAIKLLDLAIELNRVSKKLFSLKTCQILVNYNNGEVEIILRREFGNSSEDDETSLIYRAPQVLLGFTESQASYVWTIGLIIDHIYHQKVFYKKLNDVLSRKDNYYVRSESIKAKGLLQRMLVKNHKERPSLVAVREELMQIFAF